MRVISALWKRKWKVLLFIRGTGFRVARGMWGPVEIQGMFVVSLLEIWKKLGSGALKEQRLQCIWASREFLELKHRPL